MKRLKRVISIITLITAMALISFGLLGYINVVRDTGKGESIQEISKNINKEDIEGKKKKAKYEEEVDFAEGYEVAEAKKYYKESIEDYGIGAIYIPSVNIKEPLLAGTSEYNLFNGVATDKESQELGEGLYVGLSHNLINDGLLKKIDKVKKGDYVYISEGDKVYAYKIEVQEVVHETDDTYFKYQDGEDNPKLLLYRCEGESGTEWRRIAYGEYVGSKNIKDVDSDILTGLGYKEMEETVDEMITERENRKEVILEGRGNDTVVEEETGRGYISNSNYIRDIALTVYGFADKNTVVYIIIVLTLIVIYYIL